MSMTISRVLPNSGNPLGPGGHNNLALLCCHFQIKARDVAAHTDARQRELLSFMFGDELWVGWVSTTRPLSLISGL